jgi:hypothetical protein
MTPIDPDRKRLGRLEINQQRIFERLAAIEDALDQDKVDAASLLARIIDPVKRAAA